MREMEKENGYRAMAASSSSYILTDLKIRFGLFI